MSNFSGILDLIVHAHADPDEVRVGATVDEIDSLANSGIQVPDELRQWLRLCRGTTAGPGGIFGVGHRDTRDIAFVESLHPKWRSLGWVPVAGDGFGNHYVIDMSAKQAIGFIESTSDDQTIVFYVASGLETFLTEWLLSDIERTGWPFDRAYVTRVDPRLLDLSPLPWE